MSVELDLRAFGVQLFDRWTALWNGDFAQAAEIMAPDFTLRYAQARSEIFDGVRRPSELVQVIDGWHRMRKELRFFAEGEAAVDLALVDELPAGRVARPYRASFVDDAGETVARSGIDLFAVRCGRIVEVWSVSSGTHGRTFYR